MSERVQLNTKEHYRLTVDGLTHNGEGVGRIRGMAIFIPDAIPGDEVEVKLISIKKSYARGLVTKTLKRSPKRIAPQCPHALECGGCQLQHMSYDAQLYWKQRQVQDSLQRLGQLEVAVQPIIGMEYPFSYRNKAQFPLGNEQDGVAMGFYRRGTHDLVDLDECGIQHPLLVKLALATKELVTKYEIPPYDEVKHTGLLRHLVGRVSFSRSQLMAVLVTRKEPIPKLEQFLEELTTKVPELVSVAVNVNPRVTNAIFGQETKVVWGDSYLIDSIGDIQYAISPRSFYQVNPKQTKVLYDLVKQHARLSGNETIWDLYCGIGTIGLYLASEANKVYGVETIGEAVADARYNAALNNIKHAHFIHGKAEEVVPTWSKKGEQVDLIVVDPPRKGCEEQVIDTIKQARPKRVIYVSCNPPTLARDLALLVEAPYHIKLVQPVDMFPQTSHVECVVLLER